MKAIKKTGKAFGILLLIWISILNLQAQEKAAIKMLARPLKDSVMLRWAPTTPLAWEFGNESGYLVERVTMLRDGRLLAKPERKLLTPAPLKPRAENEWEAIMAEEFSLVAAQAIHGETFEVEGTGSYGAFQVFQKSKELELRWSFALSAADFNPKVADYSGLLYVDKDVQANEKYLYRVYLAKPAGNYPVDTAFVYTSVKDYAPLPQPYEVYAEFGDQVVDLSWNFSRTTDFYVAYHVERSTDGKTYQRINESPIVPVQAAGGRETEFLTHIDSLEQNNTEYHYRVLGISPFGEKGPPSKVLSGKGIGTIKNTPAITTNALTQAQHVLLEWEFPYPDSVNLAFFRIQRAPKIDGPYSAISENLAPEITRYTDKEPAFTNYYKVEAHDAQGNTFASFPVLQQLADSFPPAAPQGLAGKIDSTGIVALSWEANTEKDIFGYRIYRANHQEEEYSQLTVSPVANPHFIDSLSLNNLANKVYYKVMAVDLRQNHSPLSEELELVKPDKIPPVSPGFTKVQSNTTGILLEWTPSPSSDVNTYLLYRSEEGKNKWELMRLFRKEDAKSFTDKPPKVEQAYQYTVVAVDESGLESVPAKPVAAKLIDAGVRPSITYLEGKADYDNKQIVIKWDYPAEGVDHFMLYRAVGEQALSPYVRISPEQPLHYDRQVKMNSRYRYMLKAMFKDGSIAVSIKDFIIQY